MALAEDLDSVPSIYIVTDNIHNSIYRESEPLFWPLWISGMYVVHIDTCHQTFIHMK